MLAPDDFLAATESFSAHLQSYYLPPHDQSLTDPDGRTSTPGGIDFINSGYGFVDGRGRGGNGHDDDGGDGDYIDHLQQPGNTKKRKVPANMTGAPHGPESGSGSGGEDEPTDRAIPTGRTDQEYDAMGLQSSAALGGTGQRRGRLSKATMAGLQHKELLKSRKRQLAAVLGALSHGDSLALDQALSTTYPFAHNRLTNDGKPPEVKIRPSRRKVARIARAYKTFYDSLHAQNPGAARHFPEKDFTFVCHSATSDRLVATKEEVAVLHARFEAELARQTARAAEAAKQAAAAAMNNRQSKRSDRSKQSRSSVGRTEHSGGAIEQNLLGSTGKTGKKKKRSALANASNPHHLRNYVPSRLPHSGQLNAAQAQANAQNLVSPLPLRFLSADVPPRRRSKASGAPIPNLTNPTDEWICPFCEYDLFYGDDQNFQRALRNRKKILKRRRRARERAAAAASGAKAASAKNSAPLEEDVNPGFEAQHEDVIAANAKQARFKEGDRGPGVVQGVNHVASGQNSMG
ncbi:unnamed protein product [Somion occarium]